MNRNPPKEWSIASNPTWLQQKHMLLVLTQTFLFSAPLFSPPHTPTAKTLIPDAMEARTHLLCCKPRRPNSPNDPSSPKVTCIGQVRAKTSRNSKLRKLPTFRSRSLRRTQQSWVHLPFGCHTLRALFSLLGSFWTCGGGATWASSCCCCSCSCELCGEERKERGSGGGNGDAEEKKRWGLRELEMVAEKLENARLVVARDDECYDDGDEEGRASNAVLLMRCRSDPTKMSAVAACFVDSAAEEKEQDLKCGVGDSAPEVDSGIGSASETHELRLPVETTTTTHVAESEEERGRNSTNAETVARRHSSAEKEQRNAGIAKELEGSRRHSFSSAKDVLASRRSLSHRELWKSSFSVEVSNVGDESEKRGLPDCLLLMMYEPKLSMEVSRETWVCTGDFVRWRPRHWRRMGEKKEEGNRGEDGAEEEVKGGSVRQCEKNKSLVELVESGPFILTRCKSEPARPSPGIGAQKGCFWRSRYEPMDVGALAAS